MATGGSFEEGQNDLLEVYLREAESIISKCRDLQHIKGMNKLEKNCRAEHKYLLSLKKKSGFIHESQLKSSNLCHFAGILHAVQVIPSVNSVMKPFHMENRSESLIVDIVAGQGKTWVKVIARKAQSLHLIWAGQGQFGERDLVKQASDYVHCADLHPVNFLTPKVNFAFYSQVTEPMAEALTEKRVQVWGERVKVNPEVEVKIQSVRDLFLDSEDESDDENSDADYDEENEEAMCHSLGLQRTLEYYSKESIIEREQAYCVADKNLRSVGAKDLCQNNSSDNNECLSLEQSEIKSGSHIYLKPKTNSEYMSSNVGQNCNLLNTVNLGNQMGFSCAPSKTTASCDSSTEHLLSDSESLQSKTSNFCCEESSCGIFQINSNFPENKISKNSITKPESISRKHEVDPFISCLLISLPEYEFSEMTVKPSEDCDIQSAMKVKDRVNFDITTLITLVSSVCHGGCNFVFNEDLLTLQAKEERERPALPKLQAFLKNKELYVCQSALKDFNTILETLGGDHEKQRAKDLMKQVTVVPDHASDRAKKLHATGKIKERSKIIFGTGDYLKAITTSANVGFVRAAEHQWNCVVVCEDISKPLGDSSSLIRRHMGVSFAVYMHPSRALTEQEEKYATKIEDCS